MSKWWTAVEDEVLSELWGTVSIPSIAARIGRSESGIINRARRLGLGPFLMGGDYVSLNQLMIALGHSNVDTYKLTSWIKNRNMPVHKKKRHKYSIRVVYLDEFWKWAEKNRNFIDFSKMEPLALGIEPEWVAEQRHKDYDAFALQRKDPWTPDEDGLLKYLLKKHKYTYPELSQKLRRSGGAIQRRCQDLGIKERPVKADNHGSSAEWTKEHFKLLCDGIKHGDNYVQLERKIRKSKKAIRGKVYNTYLTESLDRVRAMMGNGNFGDGAPEPTVKQAKHLSGYRADVRNQLAYLAALLKFRANELGYDPYWQRFMCKNWDDVGGCGAGCGNCDNCTEFIRIREQYCKRCGSTFFEREENDFCEDCRKARKKAAQKKYVILTKRRKTNVS